MALKTNRGTDLPLWVEPGGAVRWRAQSPDGRLCSASWIAFSAKNSADFYVAQRQLAGTAKVSFHKDELHAGFTSDDVSKEWQGEIEGGSRHLDKWKRPPEFAEGWERLYEIVHPFSEFRSYVEPDLAVEEFVPLPCGAEHGVFIYVLGALTTTPVQVEFPDSIHVATLELGKTERAIVIASIQPWSSRSRFVAAYRDRARPGDGDTFASPDHEIDRHSSSTRLTINGRHEDGVRFAVDLAGSSLSI